MYVLVYVCVCMCACVHVCVCVRGVEQMLYGLDGIMCIKDTYVVCKYVQKTLLETVLYIGMGRRSRTLRGVEQMLYGLDGIIYVIV
jgi:hypothetical protein